MAQLIQDIEPPREKRYNIKFPKMVGKFGFSIELGKKQIFIGFVVADIELETVVRRRRTKVFSGNKVRFLRN